MSSIKVAEGKKVKIKAKAYIQMLMHGLRFYNEYNPKLQNVSFGLLVGLNNGKEYEVQEILPVQHNPMGDVVFDERLIRNWTEYNNLKHQEEKLERCFGFYKVQFEDVKLKARDARNLATIQNMDPNCICLIMDIRKFLKEQEYGFSIFQLEKDVGRYHDMNPYVKIKWQIAPIEDDKDEIVGIIKDMIDNIDSDKPFIDEWDEEAR
jgi:hypothetical protein